MYRYREIRTELLSKLREAGVKAPAKMYPIHEGTIADDWQEDQIDRMRRHLVQIQLDKEQFWGPQ